MTTRHPVSPPERVSSAESRSHGISGIPVGGSSPGIEDIRVYIDGMELDPSLYSIKGGVITFSSEMGALENGTTMTVRYDMLDGSVYKRDTRLSDHGIARAMSDAVIDSAVNSLKR